MRCIECLLYLCILPAIFAASPPSQTGLTVTAPDGSIGGKKILPECVTLLRIFSVQLQNPLLYGEVVGLTGDHAQLGGWNLDKSLAMLSTEENGNLNWRLTVPVCSRDRIYYRYFIYVLDAAGNKQVRNWEGNPRARYLEPNEVYKKSGVELYGEFGSERGWLCHKYLVELQFIWEKQLEYGTAGNFSDQSYLRLHMLPFERVGKELVPPPTGEVIVEVSRAGYNYSQLREMPKLGVIYKPGDVLLFQITAPKQKRYVYQLTVRPGTGDQVPATLMVQSRDLKGSDGVLKLALESPYQGSSLQLPYLVVRPLPFADVLTMSGSYHHFWPTDWPPVDVGSRGFGRSYYDGEAPYVENTLASFLYAQSEHADMVKVDVVMTRDYVPVLWHDFGFYTAPNNLEVLSESQLRFQLIKDISYAQLKRSRVFVKIKQHLAEYTHFNVPEERQEERIFLKLIEAYRLLPTELGIIVDLKWPQPLEKGGVESSSHSLDKNRFVDSVLNTTLWHTCGRPITFSSFDADTCTMLRLKQNIYPVMFLSFGHSTLWKPYKDLRTRSFFNAVNFAQAQDLLGTAPRAEQYLAPLLDLALKLGQVVFVWGDNMKNSDQMELYKRLKATGVVYDQMYLHGPINKRRGVFNVDLLNDAFGMRCTNIQEIIDIIMKGVKK